jgi:hypothetical protein
MNEYTGDLDLRFGPVAMPVTWQKEPGEIVRILADVK